MRIRWRDFEIPNTVVCEESSRTAQYGKFVIEPRFAAAFPFSEGLARFFVYDGEVLPKWGYIDKTGKVVIKPQFSEAEDFKDGLAQVNGLMKDYIDKTGKYVWRNERKAE